MQVRFEVNLGYFESLKSLESLGVSRDAWSCLGFSRSKPFFPDARGEKDMCEVSCAVTELRDETGKETEGKRDNKRDEDGAEIENESKMERE